MKTANTLLGGFAAAALLLGSCVSAHETLVKVKNPNPAKGEQVEADIYVTHVVIDSSEEVLEPHQVDVALVQNGKSTAMKTTPDHAAKLTRVEPAAYPENGAAWLTVHQKPRLYSQTPEGMKEGDKDSIKGAKVLFTNKYEKFAKVLLNADPADASYAEPVGHLLEIVPAVNPAALKVGDELKITILYDGKPVFMPVMASYDGFTGRGGSYAYYTSPESADDIGVKLHQPGFWVVVVNHKVAGGKDIRTHSLNAVLEFEVK